MQLEEFQKGLSVQLSFKDLKLLSDHEVFVAYAWHWKLDDDSEDNTSNASGSTNSLLSSQSETEADVSPTTHTLTFKCMGTVKDPNHQDALREAAASLKDGNETPVRLQPEPENPFDANAIAFDCLTDNGWRRIGYVDIHDALSKEEIISVKFAWVKFLLCWRHSGPGFCVGVDVSKRGSWSLTCKHFASTM